jgi:hypothetical protein
MSQLVIGLKLLYVMLFSAYVISRYFYCCNYCQKRTGHSFTMAILPYVTLHICIANYHLAEMFISPVS